MDEPAGAVECTATAETYGRTGVEMEALTAVSVGLLTIYDMCKAVDRGMRFEAHPPAGKTWRKSGHWTAPGDAESRRSREPGASARSEMLWLLPAMALRTDRRPRGRRLLTCCYCGGMHGALSAQESDAAAAGRAMAHDVYKGNCLACHRVPGDPLAVSLANIGPPIVQMRERFPDRAVLRAQIWDSTARNP